MSSVFGKRPKVPKPPPPAPSLVSDTVGIQARQDMLKALAKRRRATILNQVKNEPDILRRTLGGA